VVEPFSLARVRRYPLDQLADLDVNVVRDGLMRVEADRRVVVTDGGQEIGALQAAERADAFCLDDVH
jgi:hypothetical protein